MSAPDSQPDRLARHREWFSTTHWSVVIAAGDVCSPQSSKALETLCRTYWYTLYVYIRRRGYSAEDAQDLTQEFFTRLIAKNYPGQADRTKGRFRSFLLLRLKHFLADEHDRATSHKRSGGHHFISLDELSPEDRYRLEPADELNPESVFERRWARTVLDAAVVHLAAEFAADGRAEVFEVLKAFQPGEQNAPSYEDAAARLGISESAIKSMIHRLRQRHRELVREQVAQTVSTAAEIDDELRHLIMVISS